MLLRRSIAFILLILIMAACEKAGEESTPSPDLESINAASTLFAQPTRAPHMTPSPTPLSGVEIDLNRVVAQMEESVLSQDAESYMTHVWEGNPAFYADHAAWAADWRDNPLSDFTIDLFSIESRSPEVAVARMTMLWSQQDTSVEGSSGGATASVLFQKEAGTWQLAGLDWSAIEHDGIRFYYFANRVQDNSPQAAVVDEYLPRIHARVTRAFDYVPEGTANIEMYESAVTLHNWTRLSMPYISHWNQPGESIKITLGLNNTAPLETDVAREYARFLLYELADNTPENYPWWLLEGASEYGSAQLNTLSRRNRIIRRIAAISIAPDTTEEHLMDWDEMQTEPAWPSDQIELAVEQAFTLVHYVDEVHGSEARNTWLRAIASGQDFDAACEEYLGLPFEELEAGWLIWMPEQL